MDVNEMISWLVGDAVSVSDPAFCARCFVLLCVLMLIGSIAHDLISWGR